MTTLTGEELIKHLRCNLADTCSYIKEINPLWCEGSMEGSNDLRGLEIIMDDPVKTGLRLTVYKDKLIVELSQLQGIPTRVPYLNNLE